MNTDNQHITEKNSLVREGFNKKNIKSYGIFHNIMFRTKKLKSKSPTDSCDFCPDPPSNEKLKSSLFWMN